MFRVGKYVPSREYVVAALSLKHKHTLSLTISKWRTYLSLPRAARCGPVTCQPNTGPQPLNGGLPILPRERYIIPPGEPGGESGPRPMSIGIVIFT